MQKLVEVGFQERKVLPFVKEKASDYLKINQEVTCKISKVDEYRGIFCNYKIEKENEEIQVSGLISRRNLLANDNPVLEEVYKYGQDITVKVQSFDSKGNAALVEIVSTEELLQEKNEAEEKILKLEKEKEEMERQFQEKMVQMQQEMQQKVLDMQKEMEEKVQREIKDQIVQDLTNKIEKITGRLSDYAEEKLQVLVEQHSAVELGESFLRVSASFDPSGLFLKQLKKDIRGCLRGN